MPASDRISRPGWRSCSLRDRQGERRGGVPHPRRLRLLEGIRDRAHLPRCAAASDRRGHLRDPEDGDRQEAAREEQDLSVALVTGANRGIGREIARQLVRDHGFTVLAGARNPGEVVADENLIPLRLDVRDPDSVGAAIAGIEANPGSLDVLVNNAGIYGDPTGAADYDLDEAHEVFETNIFGPWRLIQASLPLLRSSASPRIVNVSSGAGQLAEMDGGHTAYRLSKAALNALTRTLATDEPKSASTRSARDGCAPTWAARARRDRSRRAPTRPSGSRPWRTTCRAAGSSATASRFPGRNATWRRARPR